MRFATSPSNSIVQNALSSGTFAVIFIAQLLAYLLYKFPGSELVWTLNVPIRRYVAPLLVQIQNLSGLGPLQLLLVLGALSMLPLAFMFRRSWLGTASCAHAALGVVILLTAYAVQRDAVGLTTASLTPVNVVGRVGFSTISLGMLAVVFFGLCVLNHVVFFARAKRNA